METKGLPRKFKLQFRNDERLLDDPNPGLSLDEVQNHIAAMYPEMASATVVGPEITGDARVFTISAKTAGVKA